MHPLSVAQATQVHPTIDSEVATAPRVGPRYRVICHDDPVTTMEFVTELFRGVFRLPLPRAVEVMLRVHGTGSAQVGLWPKSVAEARVKRSHALARAAGFPLTLTVEEEG